MSRDGEKCYYKLCSLFSFKYLRVSQKFTITKKKKCKFILRLKVYDYFISLIYPAQSSIFLNIN